MSSQGFFYTPEDQEQLTALQRKQAFAQALLKQGQSDPSSTPYGGLAGAGRSVIGAILANKANDREADLAKAAGNRYSQDLGTFLGGQQPITPTTQTPTPVSQPVTGASPQPQASPVAGAPPQQTMAQPQAAPAVQPGSMAALLATHNPGLIQQYAPTLMQHQWETQEKTKRPLTPDEIKARNLRPGGSYEMDNFGNVSVVQAPDTKSPDAVAQDLSDYKARKGIDANQPLTAYQKAELAGQASERGEKVREFNLTNPMAASGGTLDLSKAPPATQATVKAMLEGRMAPPSSFALSKPYWQSMMALANSADPTFDQTAWGARASARKDFLGGGKSYQTLNSGNTAIQHLGHLHDQIGDVSGMQVPLVGNMLNAGANALSQSGGQPGVNAYNDTLGHLAEETTKFYRGTGGAETDVQRNMGNLDPSLSTAQKSAGVKNTVDLIYGKLQPMVEQYNKTMGTNYPPSHFLSQKSISTLKKMGFDPDTGDTLQAKPNAGGGSASSQVIRYDASGNRIP